MTEKLEMSLRDYIMMSNRIWSCFHDLASLKTLSSLKALKTETAPFAPLESGEEYSMMMSARLNVTINEQKPLTYDAVENVVIVSNILLRSKSYDLHYHLYEEDTEEDVV